MIYQVYVRTNDNRRITAVNSSGFISDASSWAKIDEGSGDRYYLAQGNYFEKALTDERGVYRYALNENNQPYELTQEQMDADYIPSEHVPSDAERIAALEAQLAAHEAAYTQGVNEA